MSEKSKNRAPVAVVTGGRRGIGRAISVALVEAKFDVVIVDLEEDADARATLAEIAERKGRAKFVAGDIGALDRRVELVDGIFAAFGTVDCLVNNAGVLSGVRGQDLLTVTPDVFDRVMNVNLRGTFFLTQEIAKRMVAEDEAGTGRPVGRSIVTITSGAVGRARTDSPEYSFSKTSLALMSQIFAVRLGRHNIATYDLRPGVTRTEMSRSAWGMYEELVEEGRFPIRRLGLPDDIARAVVTLASGGLSYVTGGFITIDGGFGIPASVMPRRPPADKK